MTTATANREEILAEIGQLELRILELKQLLPSPLKRFFHFRCEPQKHVFVYAGSVEQAERLLLQRMTRNYGEKWRRIPVAPQVYDDPQQAAAAAPCNLLTCLSEVEAREFIADYRDNVSSGADKPKLKHSPKSRLEIDIEDYELRLRMKQK